MKRFLPLLVLLSAIANKARAAGPTDVADAFDSYERGGVTITNKFEANLRLWFDAQTASGTISREPVNRPSVSTGCVAGAPRNCIPLDEVAWKSHVYWLRLQAEFGLYKDLSLSIATGYAISQKFEYGYAAGITPETSSVDTTTGEYFFLGGDGTRSKQRGWGALDFTLRYAVLNEDRDDTAPSLVVGFGVSTPWISKTYKPAEDVASAAQPAGMGDGMYRLLFSTAASKRWYVWEGQGDWRSRDRQGFIEPYFTLSYALPIASGKAPDELRHSDTNPFGHGPSHVIESRIGAEIIPYSNTRALRRIGFAVGGVGRFFTSGRNYSILTPAVRELTWTQEYFDIGGQLAVIARISAFVHVTLGMDVVYTTPHFITGESPGNDTNGDGVIDQPNPYYCGNTLGDKCSPASSSIDVTYDQTGTRFRDAGHITFNWFGNLAFTF